MVGVGWWSAGSCARIVDVAAQAQTPDCSFRRVGPPELRAALAPGGAFHDLVELAKTEPMLDLHVRAFAGDAGERVGHATLYLGLTQVISLHQRGDRFWLDGPRTTKTFKAVCAPYFAGWTAPRPLDELNAAASARGEYIAKAIVAEREVGQGRWTRSEGALQAALSQWPERFELLDRESVLQHSSDDVRRTYITRACAPAKAAANKLGYTKGIEKGFGNELDGLAVDVSKRILVIEAKDGSDVVGVGWTPAQVSVYLRLLQRWVNESPQAAADLQDMLEQRRQLGFPSSGTSVARPLHLVPVIVLKAPLADVPRANRMMRDVRGALADEGEMLNGLEVWVADGTELRAHHMCDPSR